MTAVLLVCAGVVAGLFVLSWLYCAWANKGRCAWCGDGGPWVYAGTGERVCLPCDESAQAEEFPGAAS